MREKRPVTSMVTFLSGITPASAGKTTRFTWDICFSQDHPRECGKNSEDILIQAVLDGITPASAGKTKLGIIKEQHKEDHPRECGKNFIYLFNGRI